MMLGSPNLIRHKPLKHDSFLRSRPSERRVIPVTVCIVARSFGNLIGVADRMLTSGDIQFEPSATPKLMGLTNSIVVLQSGDAALNAEIMSSVSQIVYKRITDNPAEWWLVKDVVDLYVTNRNIVKRRRAESELLSPLGLSFDTYRDEITKFGNDNAQQLMRDIVNFELPHSAVIVTGIDPTGAHIYVIDDGYISCNDTIGFAAIGIGARHAESQFMFARHSPNEPIVDTGLLAYIAKKRAEVAPGVGQATDMFTAGPAVGSVFVLPESTVNGFEEIYRRLREKEEGSRDEARREANAFIAKAAATAAERAEGQRQSTAEGETVAGGGQNAGTRRPGETT